MKFLVAFFFAAFLPSIAAQLTWTLPSTPPRAGDSAFISTANGPLTIRNASWEVLDSAGNVVDVAKYNSDSTSLSWDIPKTLPSGSYTIRRTDSTGTYTSPAFVTTSADFSPCATPPHVPVTLSNVTAVRFGDPGLLDAEYSSIFINWDYINEDWRFGSGINPPIVVELVGISKFVIPSSQATFTTVYASLNETASSSSSVITAPSVNAVTPVVIRLSFSRAGDSARYTYLSDAFFLTPTLFGRTTCPLDYVNGVPPSGSNLPSSRSSISLKSPNAPNLPGDKTNENPPSEPSSTPVAAIVGGVIAGVVVIGGVIGVFVWRRRKQAQPSNPPAPYAPPPGPPGPGYPQPGYMPPPPGYPQPGFQPGFAPPPPNTYSQFGIPAPSPLVPPKSETSSFGNNNSFIPANPHSIPNSENTYVNSSVPAMR